MVENQKLRSKLIEYKHKIEDLSDRNKNIEDMLKTTEESKHDQVKQMERRIDERVTKLIAQKHEEMKNEKAQILEKYKLYEKKIQMQKQQLKEAQQIIHKQRQMGIEEKSESFRNTLDKLINSEKNLDQLKVMYHQLASNKEVMKKDMAVLEKKYKRSQQKIKQYDQELKMTRQQVSTFKIKFRRLMEFISQKGGFDVL